jgi:signal transduction histidine kinase
VSHPALAVQLSMAGELEDLGEVVNLTLYRIVQEALTNCVRHARASHFYIDLTRGAGPSPGVLLEMRDDGQGFDTEATGQRGSGLTGIRDRVDLRGGRFELLSAAGQGVTIRIGLPLQ